MRGKISYQLDFCTCSDIYEIGNACPLTSRDLDCDHTLMAQLLGDIWEAGGGQDPVGGCREHGGMYDGQGEWINYYAHQLCVAGYYSVQHAPLVHQISMRLESVSISVLTALAWLLGPDGADRNVLAWWVSDVTVESQWTAHRGASASASAYRATTWWSSFIRTTLTGLHLYLIVKMRQIFLVRNHAARWIFSICVWPKVCGTWYFKGTRRNIHLLIKTFHIILDC